MPSRIAVWFVAAGATAACGCASPSSNPSPAQPPAQTSTPPPASGFSIDMPVAAGEWANAAYGLWPFGVHGGGHAADGHPGWDVEFVPGASALAAADGIVLHAAPEPGGTRLTLRINHIVNGATAFATDYVGLTALAPGVAAGAAVRRGQALGPAGVLTQMIGTTPVTWAMIHFQVNDFSRNEGLTNQNAVSPESFLAPSARPLFDTIWRSAAYRTEWCEPFVATSRSAGFPMSRTWTRVSGGLPAVLDVRCASDASTEFDYTLRDQSGAAVETGTFALDPARRPSTVDVRVVGGGVRLGLWDVVSGEMRLALGGPGETRPGALDGATIYTTR